MAKLEGKSALVTGASRGIGRAIAQKLAAQGALVAVHFGTGRQQAESCVEAIKAKGGQAYPVAADLASVDEIAGLFERIDAETRSRLGESRLDILVNNAGISQNVSINDVTPEFFDRTVAINMRAPFFVAQHAAKRMLRGGRIVNISSSSTRVAYPQVSVYSMTKAALANMSLFLAQEFGARGITVNTVVPGIVETDMSRPWLTDEVRKGVYQISALGRLATLEEVAATVAFLASDDAASITAQAVEVSAGCRI
jgi:3-oxoacyl-[acyl-carrier protein] reductase